MCFPTAPISRCSSFVRLCVNLAQFVSSGRDATMILLAYRHGLRVSELVGLRREQVDLRQGLLHVRRRKNGLPSTHPLRGPELRALHKVLRDDPDAAYVFVSERRAPMTAATGTSSTRSSIPSLPPIASTTSGKTDMTRWKFSANH